MIKSALKRLIVIAILFNLLHGTATQVHSNNTPSAKNLEILYIPVESQKALSKPTNQDCNIVIANNYGKIEFKEAINPNEIPDFEQKIQEAITLNHAHLRFETESIKELDIPAKVTFYEVYLADPNASTIHEKGYEFPLSEKGVASATEIQFLHRTNLIDESPTEKVKTSIHEDFYYLSPSTKPWLIAEITDWRGEYYLSPNMNIDSSIEVTASARYYSIYGTVNDVSSDIEVYFDDQLVATFKPEPNGVIYKAIEIEYPVSTGKVIAKGSSGFSESHVDELNTVPYEVSTPEKAISVFRVFFILGFIGVLLYLFLIFPRIRSFRRGH